MAQRPTQVGQTGQQFVDNITGNFTDLFSASHSHPSAAKAIADGLTETPPTQASVQEALEAANQAQTTADGKQDMLIAGQNITIEADGRTINATGGNGGISAIHTDSTIIGDGTEAFPLGINQDEIEAIGTPVIPDYVAISSPVITENNGEWTAERDGFINVEAGANATEAGWIRLNVWIAGQRVLWDSASSAQSTGNLIRVSGVLPVGAGDEVKVEIRYADGLIENEYVVVRFIPPRDIVLGTGERGATGARGLQGERGEPGLQGIPGNICEQGIQGIPVTVGTIVGAFDTLEELETAIPIGSPGEFYYINPYLYVWDSVSGKWFSPGSIAGPQGIQGIQGVPGEQGIQGARGEQGEPGATGARGERGEQGIQGIPGASAGDVGGYGYYVGADLTERFADEIDGDPWTWIQSRIQNGDYRGINISDFIPFQIGTAWIMAEIAGINTYTGSGEIRVGNHIDFIGRDLFNQLSQWNFANFAQGMAANHAPWKNCNIYALLNGLAMDVPETVGLNPNMRAVDYTTTGVFPRLPQELQNVIVEKHIMIPQRFNATVLQMNETSSAWQDIGKLWLPAEVEVTGNAQISGSMSPATHLHSVRGFIQYPVFAKGMEHRVKRASHGGNPANWWTLSNQGGNATTVVNINTQGVANNTQPTSSMRLPICFRIA